MTWKTFGDDHLKNAPETLRVGALAVLESRRQVMEANRAGSAAGDDDARSEEVLDLLPDPASVDKATVKAVSYIPWAAQSLTGLIYRQRGAGALELQQRLGIAGSVLGPVVKANIAAIADPGRENELRQLEEERRLRDAGRSSRRSSRCGVSEEDGRPPPLVRTSSFRNGPGFTPAQR